MRVFENNCVFIVNIFDKLEVVYGFDYSIVLNLYVCFNGDDGFVIWDFLSGKVVVEFDEFDEVFCDVVFCDMLFFLGNCVGVSLLEYDYGGYIQIYNFGKVDFEEESLVIDKDFFMIYFGVFVLFLQKNLFVIELFFFKWGVYEIFMDWNDLKVLKCREIILGDGEDDDVDGFCLISCLQDYQVLIV